MIGNLIWYCKICYFSRFSQEKSEFGLSKLMNSHFLRDILFIFIFLNRLWELWRAQCDESLYPCRRQWVGLILLTLLGTVIFNDNRSHGSHFHIYVSKFKLATLWVLKNTQKLLPFPELWQQPRTHTPHWPHDLRWVYLFHFRVHSSLPPWFRALNVEFHTDAL